MTAGPFCQTWGAGAGSSASTTADIRDFVSQEAPDVEEDVVDEEDGPGANADDAEDKLDGNKINCRSWMFTELETWIYIRIVELARSQGIGTPQAVSIS